MDGPLAISSTSATYTFSGPMTTDSSRVACSPSAAWPSPQPASATARASAAPAFLILIVITHPPR